MAIAADTMIAGLLADAGRIGSIDREWSDRSGNTVHLLPGGNRDTTSSAFSYDVGVCHGSRPRAYCSL